MSVQPAQLSDQEDELCRKVTFLKRPESYPDATTAVEAIETHMSWVFLTDRYAYKLKKPVRYPFLDFGTLERRRHNCREELRLNRRLASNVYLEVAPLTIDEHGRLGLGKVGEPVDWLVKMLRLPDARRLDVAIREHRLEEDDVRRLGERLARFYRGLPSVALGAIDYRRRFAADVDMIRGALLRPDYQQDRRVIGRLCDALLSYLGRHAEVLDRRVAGNRIVEGHGDLRPEHVYLGDDIIVTDCLEFNRELRILDPADELAYLAMECERLGAPLVRRWLFEAYHEHSGDTSPDDLIDFYTSFRACLRARIALAHLDEPVVTEPNKWIERGRRYVDVGLRHAADLG